ncbi:uncharacterized protein AKAME5_002014400 [Lates japonicus]|uniref:Tyrosinase copper-binding domain-containing protein n=1 Tax=Lates japonicus TaxID=270547 RepID=A0AAD3N9Q8_LATJO|nr:uncharacterized protein AKAME5_002014400 [Lates japonicus]
MIAASISRYRPHRGSDSGLTALVFQRGCSSVKPQIESQGQLTDDRLRKLEEDGGAGSYTGHGQLRHVWYQSQRTTVKECGHFNAAGPLILPLASVRTSSTALETAATTSFSACRDRCMFGACCLHKPRHGVHTGQQHHTERGYNNSSVNRTLWGYEQHNLEDEMWYSIDFNHIEVEDLKENPKRVDCPKDPNFTYTCEYLTLTHCQALVNDQAGETQAVSFSPGVKCSERKEIRDLTLRETRLYQRAIRKLYARSAAWKGFALLRTEFSPQAGNRAFFLPWHRYFLRLVERELQSMSSCKLAIPYFEWTVDSGSMKSSAAWQQLDCLEEMVSLAQTASHITLSRA